MATLETLDRFIFERAVLPAFAARADVSQVLFVGCAEYTRFYEQIFAGKHFYTLDVDPRCSLHGSSQPGRHFIASLSDVAGLFQPQSLDVVFVNGVFGYGLDDPAAAERAVAGCYDILRDGGTLMVGWNDLPQCKPFEIVELEPLRAFAREPFPPFDNHPDVLRQAEGEYLVQSDYRHVFNFFRKPAA